MGLITPDFTEAQDSFEPGEYFMRITGQEKKVSKNGGDYLSWELSSFNEANPKNNGRKIWHTTMLSGRGAGMLKAFYKASTGKDFPVNGSFDTEELINKEIKAVIGIDDQMRAQTKAIKPVQ